MTTAIMFSRQNDAGSRASNTQYWENLVLVVVLVSESNSLECLFSIFPKLSGKQESDKNEELRN